MKKLLYANLIAQATTLYSQTSNIDSVTDMSDKAFGAVAGIFSVFMVISFLVPLIIFGLVFYMIFKTIRAQNRMHSNVYFLFK